MAEGVWSKLQEGCSWEELRVLHRSAGSCCDAAISVTLQSGSLWKQFHELTTEMVVTRRGRLARDAAQ